jgi:predicted nucleic-acid-binding protein
VPNNSREATLFVDTNVFLRYLTNDVPKQAERAEQIFRSAADGAATLITNVVVVAEIVWTLESYYKIHRPEIRELVLAILNSDGLEIENADLILQAVTDYVDLNIDFADAYDAAWSLDRGVSQICTFDARHFNRVDGIEVISP